MQQVSVQLFLYSTALMIILCDEGTAKGDPTEANWVGKHFSRNRELIVGSVKGNIGCGSRFFSH
jgi:putative methionine-R-sulfoxide reductase with GAF domain